MSNWTSITADDLKAMGHGMIVDRAAATATGDTDPVAWAIGSAVARVRRACGAGNPLDADPTKVPRSLQDVTVRLAVYALMERIRFPMSEDQRETRKNDNSDLLRISDRKVKVELPDTVSDEPEIGPTPGTWNSERKVLGRTHPHPAPGVQNPAQGYANPDGTRDSVT
jgi:hypothetical protein